MFPNIKLPKLSGNKLINPVDVDVSTSFVNLKLPTFVEMAALPMLIAPVCVVKRDAVLEGVRRFKVSFSKIHPLVLTFTPELPIVIEPVPD